MTSCQRRSLLPPLLLAMACASAALPPVVRAQTAPGLDLIKGGGTPAAIRGVQDLEGRGCPLLVSPVNAGLQPLWIPPAKVAAKNQLGCLSAADAHYGADGCPTRLCGKGSGEIPLPSP